jgi:hypothetical protein
MASTEKKSRNRRVLVILGVLLFAGMLFSLGTAWGVEVVRAYRTWRRPAPTGSGAIRTWRNPGPPPPASGLDLERVSAFHNPKGPSVFVERRAWFGRQTWLAYDWPGPDRYEGPQRSVPSWLTLPQPGSGGATSAHGFGFPFPCLKYDHALSRSQSAFGFSHVLRWRERSAGWDVYLPLAPIYSGLVANSLMYAAVLGSPWMVRAVVRSRRFGRGRCPACGYNIRGEFISPCPECGRIHVVMTDGDRRQ